jgi:tetratricopeptide (TPR) repeat protein
MKKISLILLAVIAGCASQSNNYTTLSTAGSTEVASNGSEVARYLAWFEGDTQTDYQVNREVAQAKLSEIEKNPPAASSSESYLEYLSLLDASGKTTEAEKKIKAFLATNPDDKRGVFLLAVHYWRLNKKELTTYFFNQLEKDNTFPWKSLLFNNLGMLALQDKNRQLALSYFEKATKAEPQTPAPLVNLGSLYLQSRSYSVAEPLFAKASRMDNEFEDAALGWGISLEGQGKFEEAHKVYSQFMENTPSALSVVYNDSVLLGNRLNRKEEASQQMLRYIQRGGKETAKAQEIIQNWR